MKKIYTLMGAAIISLSINAQSNRSIANVKALSTPPLTNQTVTTATTTALFPASIMTCTSDAHILSTGTGTAYAGYVVGTNAYGDHQKAQKYSLTTYSLTTPATITAVSAYIGYKTGTAHTITAKIYSDNTGAVGTLLGTSNAVSLSAISTSSLTSFTFTAPVALTGTAFYVSVDMTNLTPATGDSIAIVSTSTCTANGSGAWEQQSSNTWYNFTNASSWGASATMDLFIFPTVTAQTVATGINNLSNDAVLFNAYPNPANSEISISYALNKESNVTIEVYNMTGKLVKSIMVDNSEVGNHSTKVDISNLEAGIYMYGLKTNSGKLFGKFTVVR